MSQHKNCFSHFSIPDICNLECPFTGQHQIYAIFPRPTHTQMKNNRKTKQASLPLNGYSARVDGKGLTLGEKLNSEQRDESLWKTPDTSRSTAISSLEDRRTLPLLSRTGTPVTKDAPITKTRRSRWKKKQVFLLPATTPQCDKTHTKINTGHIVAVCEACIRYKHAYKSIIFRLHSFI